MKKDFSQLIDILKQERDVYKELLGIAKQEKEVLVAGEADKLMELTKLTESLVTKARRLEEKRLDLLGITASSSSSNEANITLSSLSAEADQETSKTLDGLQEEMTAIVNSLGELNKSNASLIERNLDYIDFLLSGLTEDDSSYSSEGDKKSLNAKLFDWKI